MITPDLLNRVKKATGEDRALGRDIHHAVMDDNATGDMRDFRYCCVTIDNAVELICYLLPGCRWSICKPADWSDSLAPKWRKRRPYEASVTVGDIGKKGFSMPIEDGSTPAVALVAAGLQARLVLDKMKEAD